MSFQWSIIPHHPLQWKVWYPTGKYVLSFEKASIPLIKERRILVQIHFLWSWHQVPMQWSPFLAPKRAFLLGWEENDMDKDSLPHTWDRWLVKTTLNGINSGSAYLTMPEKVINPVPSWVFFHILGLFTAKSCT